MYAFSEKPLYKEELERLLLAIDNAKIGLIGDLCLDMYWIADMKLSELSRETPHFPLPIVSERYQPGGAGNAVCNIAALRPGKLLVVGLVGEDWRGELLKKALAENEISTEFIVQDTSAQTNAYIKPLRHGISDVVYEDPRLDFENRSTISPECEEKLLLSLEKMAKEVDVICVSDQMKFGCITPRIRERLGELGAEGKTIIADSRDRISLYKNVIVKPNEVEAARAFELPATEDLDVLSDMAAKLSEKTGKTALMTLGGRGCFVAEGTKVTRCPACPVEPPIDFCGAGDTFLSGFGTLIASGADPISAAKVATLCSAVTIKKLDTTGTATRQEVLDAWEKYFG